MHLDGENGDARELIVLVVSSDSYNQINTGTTTVVPVFSYSLVNSPSQVRLSGAGLRLGSTAIADCEKIKSVRTHRLTRCHGMVCNDARQNVTRVLANMLGIRVGHSSAGWGGGT